MYVCMYVYIYIYIDVLIYPDLFAAEAPFSKRYLKYLGAGPSRAAANNNNDNDVNAHIIGEYNDYLNIIIHNDYWGNSNSTHMITISLVVIIVVLILLLLLLLSLVVVVALTVIIIIIIVIVLVIIVIACNDSRAVGDDMLMTGWPPSPQNTSSVRPVRTRRIHSNTPNLPTDIVPTNIARVKLSGKSPMGLRIPPL